MTKPDTRVLWPHTWEGLQMFFFTLRPRKPQPLHTASCFYPGNLLEHPLPMLGNNTNIPSQPQLLSPSPSSPTQQRAGVLSISHSAKAGRTVREHSRGNWNSQGGGTCLESHSETEGGAGLASRTPSSYQAISARVPALPI